MRELDEVDPIALAIVGVHFLAPLQIVQAHAEVLAARHQVLPVVADVNRVDLLLLQRRGLTLKVEETRQKKIQTTWSVTESGSRVRVTYKALEDKCRFE